MSVMDLETEKWSGFEIFVDTPNNVRALLTLLNSNGVIYLDVLKNGDVEKGKVVFAHLRRIAAMNKHMVLFENSIEAVAIDKTKVRTLGVSKNV